MPDTIVRGDTALWTIPLVDNAAAPYNLTGCTVWVVAKADISDPDSSALFTHKIVIDGTGTVTTTQGLTLQSTAAAGVLVEELTPAESAMLPVGGTAVYDVQVKLPNGRIFTPINAAPLGTVAADVAIGTT